MRRKYVVDETAYRLDKLRWEPIVSTDGNKLSQCSVEYNKGRVREIMRG
jgi:hypothetical protein